LQAFIQEKEPILYFIIGQKPAFYDD
jgi:hypothetical protein